MNVIISNCFTGRTCLVTQCCAQDIAVVFRFHLTVKLLNFANLRKSLLNIIVVESSNVLYSKVYNNNIYPINVFM